MSTILITGGTGLIGKAITKILVEKGHQVIILSRNPETQKKSDDNVRYVKWDIEKQVIDTDALKGTDYVIHLAGANVGEKRWTDNRKQEIVQSRTKSGALLVKYLADAKDVKAVISASAIGWYGPDPFIKGQKNEAIFKESDPHSEDFLGQTCGKWESSIEPVTTLGKRLVILRTGIVLSNDGGALLEFQKPLKFGVATILGGGKQVISWIHIDDLVRMYITAIENEKLHGVYNAVAPQPVTNKELVLTLARVKRKNFFIPIHVPSFVLKIVLGGLSIEILKSATVSAKKIKSEGFTFLYPSIEAALRALS